MRLIKLAHKVIVCQASITDNVFNLLKFRNNETMLFIKNEYKNYKGIDAHIIKNENSYYELLNKKLKIMSRFLWQVIVRAKLINIIIYC